MRTHILLFAILTGTPLFLSAQENPGSERGDAGHCFGPGHAEHSGSYLRTPSFFAVTLDLPVLSRFTFPSTGPMYELSGMGDSGTFLDQPIGYGAGVLWRTRPESIDGIRYGLDLDFRHLRGGGHSSSLVTFENGATGALLGEERDFSLDLLRLGATLEYELMSHPTPGDDPLIPADAPIDAWWSIVFSARLNGVWRVGSEISVVAVPDDPDVLESLGATFPLTDDGRGVVLDEGAIEGLNDFTAEFEGGASVEIRLGSTTFLALGLYYTRNLVPLTDEGWSYESLNLRTGLGFGLLDL